MNGDAFILDYGSSNGTYVNGTRVLERTQLNEGDSIDAGSVKFIIDKIVAVPADDSDEEAEPARGFLGMRRRQPVAAGVSRARKSQAGPKGENNDLILKISIVLGILIVASLAVLFVASDGNDTGQKPTETGSDQTDDTVIEEIKPEPPSPEEARVIRIQEQYRDLKQYRDTNPEDAVGILSRYEQLLQSAAGTSLESIIRDDLTAYRQECESNKQAKYLARIQKVRDHMTNSYYFSALKGCIGIYTKGELTDEQKDQLRMLVKDIAVRAKDSFRETVEEADLLCTRHKYEDAVSLVEKRAEKYGLVDHEYLKTLKIQPYSKMLLEKINGIKAKRKEQYSLTETIVRDDTARIKTLLRNKEFKKADEYCDRSLARIHFDKLKEEISDLKALSSKCAGIKKRLISILNKKTHYSSELRGTFTKADDSGIFFKDRENPDAVVKLAWRNMANDKLFHVIRISGVVRSEEDKRTLGAYFYLIGDVEHSRIYLKGLKEIKEDTRKDVNIPSHSADDILIDAPRAGGRNWNILQKYTSFMWFYGGPPRSKAAYKAMGYYFITGGRIEAHEDSSAEKADAGIKYFVDDTAGKGILEPDADTGAKAYAAYTRSPNDTAAAKRPLCYNNPQNEKQVRQAIKQSVSAHKGGKPCAYSFGAVSTGIGNYPVTWCFCPHCLRRFRTFLSEKYGDISILNAVWETDFTSFDEAVPPTLHETIEACGFLRKKSAVRDIRYPDMRLAAFNDFRTWRDINFSRFLKNCTDYAYSLDSSAPAGVSRLPSPSAFGGYDYSRLVYALNWIGVSGRGISGELLRSFTDRSYPRLFVHTINNTAPDMNAYWAWYSCTHGYRGTVLWSMGRAFTSPPNVRFKQGLPPLKETYRLIRGHIGQKLMHAWMRTHKIAIYYSQPSIRFCWFLDAGLLDSAWPEFKTRVADDHSSYARSCGAFADIIENSGYQYEYISCRTAAKYGISPDTYSILILPKTAVLSKQEADMIRDYVQNGGWVIADYQTGVADGYLNGRQKGILDEMFGIKRQNYMTVEWYDSLSRGSDAGYGFMKPARVGFRGMLAAEEGIIPMQGSASAEADSIPVIISNSLGTGKTFYLNLNILNYGDIRFADPSSAERMRIIIDNIIRKRGILPPVEVYRDKRFFCNCEKIIWEGDKEDYLFLILNGSSRENDRYFIQECIRKPYPVIIKLNNGKKHITRLTDGQNMGTVEEWKDLFIPCQASVYVLK